MARLVGLDIGSRTIKIVELEQSGGRGKLVGVGHSATPPKGLLSEATMDQQVLSEAINKTFVDARITTKSVNVALPESLVFTRVISMPQLTDKELTSAIRWEAEQYIPLPLSEAILDYEIMSKSNAGMHVFLVAAPKSLVAKYQRIMALAGLDLVSIETEALALARALMDPNPSSPVALVVSIGAERTNVFVAKGINLILTYVIPTGGNALTRALSADLGIDSLQAEEYKKTYGLNKEVFSGKVGTAVKPILDNLVSELKRTMNFYQSKGADNEPIRRVVLTGGSAKLPGLVVFLAENLGIETQIGDPWQKVSDTAKLSSLPFDPVAFSEAVGLALKPLP